MPYQDKNEKVILQDVFNAIPLPIFIVDYDMRISQFNKAAETISRNSADAILRKRGGEALHCIHASETPEGCGHSPSCGDCVIRNSLKKAQEGGKVYREKTAMQLRKGKDTRAVSILVTASPLTSGGKNLTILILEDISELLQLRSLLPICAWCKKIRNDDNYWQSVEEYFGTHLELDFTHGMCEECYKKFIEEEEKE